METPTINTTHRWSQYCTAVNAKGQKCHLYAPHSDGHLPKNGTEKDRWTDE